MSMGTHLAKLLSFIIANVSDSTTTPRPTAKSLTCYSCMSPLYASKLKSIDGTEIDLWESTSNQYFRKPDNFTRYCDPETFNPSKLKIRSCLDTCIWLSTDNTFLGKTHRTYMRGCLSDLKEHNFTLTKYLKYRNHCSNVTLRALFNSALHSLQPADQRVYICACHDNRCNGASRRRSSSGLTIALLISFVTLIQL